jgi:hypothetical protein
MEKEFKEMTFTLSPAQVQKFIEWKKDKVLPGTTIGGAYTVCFTPTGLGDFVEVRCADGTTLMLTDYNEL